MSKHLYCAIRNGELVEVARRKQYLDTSGRNCIKTTKTQAINHYGISRSLIENWMKVNKVKFYLTAL